MSDQPIQSPKISIKLNLSPTTYHFSNPTPPTLSLSLTSHADRPLTICIPHSSPLNLKAAMAYGAFPITDLTTSPPTPLKITDLTGRVNRRPTPKELLSLRPGEAASFSVAFTRGGSYEPAYRPQPWHIVKRGLVLDENGKQLNIRRSKSVCGVDGLEAGKRYRVTVALGKLLGVTWLWGTKEEVESGAATVATFEDDGETLRLPLEFEVEGGGVEFSVEE